MAKNAKFGIGILISADDKASRVIGHVAASTKTLGMGIGKVFSGLAKAGAWAGGIAAVGTGIAATLGKQIIDTTGELKDFAAQTGFGVEALQEWQYASKQAGVDSEAFAGSIGFLNKNLGALKGGQGTLFAFLKQRGDIGFMKQLKSASPAQALDLIIRKMERIQDPATRAALATSAFGRSGAVMARLAIQGSASLDVMRQRARALGLVMGGEAVDSVEALGDQIDEAKAVIGALGRDILVSLVPGIAKGTAGLVDWVAANRKMIVGKAVDFLRDMWRGLERIGEWVQANGPSIAGVLGKGFNLLGEAFKFASQHGEAIKGILLTMGSVFVAGKLVGGVEGLAKALPALSAALGPSFVANLNPAIMALVALGTALMAANEAAKAFDGIMEDSIRDEIVAKTGAPAFTDRAAAEEWAREQAILARGHKVWSTTAPASQTLADVIPMQTRQVEVTATINVGNAPPGTTATVEAPKADKTTVKKHTRMVGW